MSPELIAAVKERVQLGYTNEQITNELRSAGYDDVTISQAINAAQAEGATASAGVPTVPGGTSQLGGTQPVSSGPLPGVFDLVSSSFSAAFKRWDLIGLMLAPQIIFVILSAVMFSGFFISINGAALAVLFPVVMLLLGVASLLVTMMVLKGITTASVGTFSIGESFSWALKNLFSFIWINILMMLAIYGGFVLLIIPGVIVSVFLLFTQFTFVAEGRKGLDALLRSRQLVIGNGWTVAGKLIAFGLLVYLAIFIPFMLLSGVVGFSGGVEVFMLMQVVSQAVSGVLSVVILFGVYRLFTTLTHQRPAETFNRDDARGKYKGLVWLGLFLPVLGVLAAIVLASLNDAKNSALEASLKVELSSARNQAELYFHANSLSYEGVCLKIETLHDGANTVCNDSDTAWAMATNLWRGDMTVGDRYCVSSGSGVELGGIAADGLSCGLTVGGKERATQLRDY